MADVVHANLQVWLDKCELTELVAKVASAVDRADRNGIAVC
jgi:hypothetical protein